MSFRVIDVGTHGKLLSSACYENTVQQGHCVLGLHWAKYNICIAAGWHTCSSQAVKATDLKFDVRVPMQRQSGRDHLNFFRKGGGRVHQSHMIPNYPNFFTIATRVVVVQFDWQNLIARPRLTLFYAIIRSISLYKYKRSYCQFCVRFPQLS